MLAGKKTHLALLAAQARHARGPEPAANVEEEAGVGGSISSAAISCSHVLVWQPPVSGVCDTDDDQKQPLINEWWIQNRRCGGRRSD
jgi:hypothetical protein